MALCLKSYITLIKNTLLKSPNHYQASVSHNLFALVALNITGRYNKYNIERLCNYYENYQNMTQA